MGTPYDDRVARTLRLRAQRPHLLGDATGPPTVLASPTGLTVREVPAPVSPWPTRLAVVAGAGALAASVAVLASWLVVAATCLVLAAGALVGRARLRRGLRVAHGRLLVAAAAERPSLARLAGGVAAGLHEAGLVSRGAEAVEVQVDHDGVHRCVLRGVPEAESDVFVAALEEALSPLLDPRYVVPRWVVAPGEASPERALAATAGMLEPDGVVWHAVPAAAGRNRRLADAYARGWGAWVSSGPAVATASAQGAGVVAAQRGTDPLDLAATVRSHWT